MHCRDVPPKVAINEAIDLAKKYSTANSGGFVNGILDRIRIDLEAQAKAPASATGATEATEAEAAE
jgi:transcription antitermination protein NusB